jgi:hypothetical protein
MPVSSKVLRLRINGNLADRLQDISDQALHRGIRLPGAVRPLANFKLNWLGQYRSDYGHGFPRDG